MMIEPGDEKRAAAGILKLVNQYALRFDPPDQAQFYGRLVRGLGMRAASVQEFIHRDDLPAKEKPPQNQRASHASDVVLSKLAIRRSRIELGHLPASEVLASASMFPALLHISANFLSKSSTASGVDSYRTSLSWRLRPVGDQLADPVRSRRPSMA